MWESGHKEVYYKCEYGFMYSNKIQKRGSYFLPSMKFLERWRTLLAGQRTVTILIISIRFIVSVFDVYHGFYSIRSGNSVAVDFTYV